MTNADRTDESTGKFPIPNKPFPWLAALMVLGVALLIAVGGFFLAHSNVQPTAGGRFGRGGRSQSGGGGQAMPVATATVAASDINIFLSGLGTVTPLRVVIVRAQVSGQLLNVAYQEGQRVKRGDLLAEIDSRASQAQLTQYEGALARDEALLRNAKIDFDRYQTLFEQDSIAKQQLDSQKSLVQQYQGTVKADQGQIDNAKLNIAYSKITAPIDGRVGLRQIDPGNYIQAGDSGGIVVITQLTPIDVLFTLPEDDLPAVQKKLHDGEKLAVDVYDRAGQVKLGSGTLASLDNQIDASTGTIKVKAEFANDDEALFPNQFVNVRVLLDVLHAATVIPTSALQHGANGLFVYVVKPDRSATVRNIKIGATEDERVAVTDGLQVGEVIVTDGADRLREGSKIELPEDNAAVQAGAAVNDSTAPQRGKQARGQGRQGQGRRHDDATNSNDGAAPTGGAKPADRPNNGASGG